MHAGRPARLRILTPREPDEQIIRVTSPDCRVALPDTSYFFLGNGLVRAAVQFAAAGQGSPLGLVIDDPSRLAPKRDALSMGPAGLGAVAVALRAGDDVLAPGMPNLGVRWDDTAAVPTVVAFWGHGELSVRERIFVPDPAGRRIVREIGVLSDAPVQRRVTVLAGEGRAMLAQDLDVPSGGHASATVVYELGSRQPSIGVRFGDPELPDPDLTAWWQGLTRLSLGSGLLDHAFFASRLQLPAVVPIGGALAAECWGGPADIEHHAAVAVACLQLGAWPQARRILEAAGASLPDATPLDRLRLRDAWHQYAWWTADDRPMPAEAATGSGEIDVRLAPSTRPLAAGAATSGRTTDIFAAARASLDVGYAAGAAAKIAWLGEVSGSRAGTWFTAYDEDGEPDADGRDDAGVSSRAWAEIVQMAVGQIIGLRPAADGVRVQPRLLPGVDRMSASLRIREMTLRLEVVADDAVGLETAYVLPCGSGEVALQVKARRVPAPPA